MNTCQLIGPAGIDLSQGVAVLAWVLAVGACLIYVRRGAAAVVGLAGALIGGAADGAYLVDELMARFGPVGPNCELSGFIFEREHLPTVLIWVRAAGLVLLVVALLLALRRTQRITPS